MTLISLKFGIISSGHVLKEIPNIYVNKARLFHLNDGAFVVSRKLNLVLFIS